MSRVVIGITADATDEKYLVTKYYAAMVACAGGVPIILPHLIDQIEDYFGMCDGFVLTGGDDLRTEEFGEPTHPEAKPIDTVRQRFEIALLKHAPHDCPILGICLGMQMMSLVAGGKLDQYLPETLPTHLSHFGKTVHHITGQFGDGDILSSHRQAVANPGTLEVIASAYDGVIEAVRDSARRFYVGIQWHAEITDDHTLGQGIFDELIKACRVS